MRPVRLKSGKVITFHWHEPDQAYLASVNGSELTDEEWNELDRILRNRQPIQAA